MDVSDEREMDVDEEGKMVVGEAGTALTLFRLCIPLTLGDKGGDS